MLWYFHGPEGNLTFTLDSADHAYRTLVETMNEGTATLSFDGTILYCNRHFAALLKMPLQSIVGTSIYRFIAPENDDHFSRQSWSMGWTRGDRTSD